jgi:hypothetical protein
MRIWPTAGIGDQAGAEYGYHVNSNHNDGKDYYYSEEDWTAVA